LVAGPYCGKLLADLGAEVIKIEAPESGDEAREKGPYLHDIPGPERSGLFLYLNSNKLGITLNIETSVGREIFQRLAEHVDILIEDKPPGTMTDLGLGYDSLSKINPRLIMLSITPFGQTGPYKDYKAYHINIFHGSGLGYLLPTYSQEPEREPVKGAGLMGEYDCGLSAAVAALVAVYARHTTDLGQYIDMSKQEALANLQRVELGEYPTMGIIEKRTTQRPLVGGLVRCKDGYVTLTARADHQWGALVQLMDNPAWAQEEWCQDESSRSENAERLRALIAEWAVQHTKDEIHHNGQRLGVITAAVNTTEDVFRSRQLQEREFFVEIEHPEAGRIVYPGAPFRLSKTPWKLTHPAPLLGEHNHQILGYRLGYSTDELRAMSEAGIL
jgi:crotonobetainyl-CoA:carnitine CoA-transferase CaiB-like acyl-CoA transferase